MTDEETLQNIRRLRELGFKTEIKEDRVVGKLEDFFGLKRVHVTLCPQALYPSTMQAYFFAPSKVDFSEDRDTEKFLVAERITGEGMKERLKRTARELRLYFPEPQSFFSQMEEIEKRYGDEEIVLIPGPLREEEWNCEAAYLNREGKPISHEMRRPFGDNHKYYSFRSGGTTPEENLEALQTIGRVCREQL